MGGGDRRSMLGGDGVLYLVQLDRDWMMWTEISSWADFEAEGEVLTSANTLIGHPLQLALVV